MVQCSVHSNCVSHLILKVQVSSCANQLFQGTTVMSHCSQDHCRVSILWRVMYINVRIPVALICRDCHRYYKNSLVALLIHWYIDHRPRLAE